MTEHAAFFQREADSLKERADFFDEAAVEEEKRAAAERIAFYEDAAGEEKKHARAERVAFFERTKFFQDQATEAKKRQKGLFSFLRRKNGKDVAAKVAAPIVETAKKAAAEARSAEVEAKEAALEIDQALRKRLREEKEQARKLAS